VTTLQNLHLEHGLSLEFMACKDELIHCMWLISLCCASCNINDITE